MHGKAQETPDTPKGEAIVTIFSNLYTGFGHYNDERGFNLERAYLGYRYLLSGNLTLQVIIDAGKSRSVDDHHYLAYIKNAFAQWRYKKLTLTGGMISTTQFNLQEKSWGRRYVLKSFQDEYGFGSSADLGVSAIYKFNPNWSADLIIANGEGYKQIQDGKGLLYGSGITWTPTQRLSIRLYGSYNETADDENANSVNAAFFVGYKHKAFSIAAEYNYQTNASHARGNDQNGISAYASIRLKKNIEWFGRWDYLHSKDRWNENEGNAAITGAEFKLGKYVRLSPNFRIQIPHDQAQKNASFAYLNCLFTI